MPPSVDKWLGPCHGLSAVRLHGTHRPEPGSDDWAWQSPLVPSKERRTDVRHTRVGVVLAITGTGLLLASCGGQAPPGNPGSSASTETEASELIGDCAADYPTYGTLESALDDTDVVIQGIAEVEDAQSTAAGAPPGASDWIIAITDPLDALLEDQVHVVAAEARAGTDPCGPRITPDQEALIFLAKDRDTYYPVAVLTETPDGTYRDADRRIPPVDLETVTPLLKQHNAGD